MNDGTKVVTASGEIADPARQPEWDGNDNLAEAPVGERVHSVGDVFTMVLIGGAVRENHVVEFEEGRRLAWRPATSGEAPAGHLWRWEIEPIDGSRSRVTHTYDWSELTDENRFERARWRWTRPPPEQRPPSGPIALTAIGRAVLSDPAAIDELVGEGSDTVRVQGDLTVIAGADLRHDIAIGIDALATVESSSGAVTWRLDTGRITRAVQGGQTADEIVAWLTEVSAVPLPDTVIRLVHDAAATAGTVKVISAPTVLVVTDPADLTVALGLKSLKLTRVTDSVAVTDVPLAKVRAALERKGLAPDAVIGGAPLEARSSAVEAAAAADRAAALRARANAGPSYVSAHADHLERHARRLADADGRLAVTGPLTLLPSVVDRLATARR